MRRPWLGAVLDALCVVVFAAIGRASHHEGNPVGEALVTAWPFLAGAAVGWAVSYAVWRVAPVSVRRGWPVWVLAVAVAMALRPLVGRGVAVSFVIVAKIVLGVLLMGWRLLLGRRLTAG